VTKGPRNQLDASGLNEIDAALNAGGVLFVGLVIARPLIGSIGIVPGAVLLALVAALAAGARYRLRISTEGVELTRLALWILPVSRKRYLLDATVELCWSLDAASPEGLAVRPPADWAEEPSECFGPTFGESRQITLCERALAALVRARSELGPATASRPRFTAAPELAVALEAASFEYWPASNRLKSARLRDAVTVGAVVLPVGSTIEANCDAYLDPRRADRLARAIPSAPTTLRRAGFPPARAGAVLGFDHEGRLSFVRGGFSEDIRMGPVTIDGSAPLSWDRSGLLQRFELGAPLEIGTVVLPAGSEFGTWQFALNERGPPQWRVVPRAPLSLPQIVVGPTGSLIVSSDFSRVLGAMVDRDLVLDGVTLRGGIGHWPLDASLHIDVAACRRMGLVRR
jgi:hypothetical protein